MVRTLLIALIYLDGCTFQSSGFVVGKETTAPEGWIDYCNRYPYDISCERNP